MLMVISTLFEIVVMPEDLGEWKALLPKDDTKLKGELTRAFLNYLGVKARATGAPKGRAKRRLAAREVTDRLRRSSAP